MNYYNYFKESFYFQVSPQREKCLKEQVSLLSKDKRSCACCQKGTVGGYPPNYSDWLQPTIGSDNWHRTDNWTSSLQNLNTITPTEFVSTNDKSNDLKRLYQNRTQKEMYTQQSI